MTAEAVKTGIAHPYAMTLATVGPNGQPSVRTMTVRHFDEQGFLFFTNMESRKGMHMESNPRAALCLFCDPVSQQVTIEGQVTLLNDADADQFWRGRNRDRQLVALASRQSSPLDDLRELKDRIQQFRQQYQDQRVPRPAHWVGYRLVPERIEFWHTGWRHLHERTCYSKSDDGWQMTRLSP